MNKQTLQVEVEVPKGYEFTGEVRPPQENEYYLESDWKTLGIANINFRETKYPILRKAEVWKPLHSGQACYFGERQDKIKIRVWNVNRTACSDAIRGTIKDLTFRDGLGSGDRPLSIRFRQPDGYTFVAYLDHVEYLEEPQ